LAAKVTTLSGFRLTFGERIRLTGMVKKAENFYVLKFHAAYSSNPSYFAAA
jgi:hypothetical protein